MHLVAKSGFFTLDPALRHVQASITDGVFQLIGTGYATSVFSTLVRAKLGD